MRVVTGDITKLRDVEVIVNAANGIGVMGAGVAGAIGRSGGEKFREEVRTLGREEGPFEPGSVYETGSGLMKRVGIQSVYHAVTMKFPGTQSSIDNVVQAVRNACRKAIEDQRESIAFPGLGTGIGGLDRKQVAHRMATCLLEYQSRIKITVADIDTSFISLFRDAVGMERETTDDFEPEQADVGAE
jgi:O-acetyl-ADP-ribose deacetylase (regulator of RNase III)